MRFRTLLSCFAILTTAVQAPRTDTTGAGGTSTHRRISMEILDQDAVRFYSNDTTLLNNSVEPQRQQQPQNSVLVVKTATKLFMINMHRCESLHNRSTASDTMNDIHCWQGTVDNDDDAGNSSALVFESRRELHTATVRYRDQVYTLENGSLSGTNNTIYIMYKDSDLIDTMPNFRMACKSLKRDRRDFNFSEDDQDDSEDYLSQDVVQYAGDRQRCVLKLVADHTYFTKIGDSNVQKTRDLMISQILRVNSILKLPFDVAPGVVEIFEKPTDVRPNETHFNMAYDENVTAKQLLESFSVIDNARGHDNSGFCLAFLFTARALDGGSVNGLSEIGHASQERGLCAHIQHDRSTGTKYVLNCGLATSMSHGHRMLTRVSDLVVAHELAHGLGAEHDPDSAECFPSDKNGGPFIMSTFSSNRYDKNHDSLSPCSVRQIMLTVKFKSRCFTTASSCGNMIRDDDEECDVGATKNDNCCTSYCKLRHGAVCSDVNDMCCKNCQLKAEGSLCKSEFPNECLGESRCSGDSERCPDQKPLPDLTECVDRGRCRAGKCIAYCEVIGMIPCLCRNAHACMRCCKQTPVSDCAPLVPNEYLVDGTMCYNGFCKNQKCQKQVRDVIERIVSIISNLSPSYVIRLLQRYGVSMFIIVSSLLWIPLGIWLFFHDKKYYNLSATPIKLPGVPNETGQVREQVPLKVADEDIPFIDETEPQDVMVHSLGDYRTLRETSV